MKYSSLNEMYRDQLRKLYGAEDDCKDIYASLGQAASDHRISIEAMALLSDSTQSLAELSELFKEIGLTTRGEYCHCFDDLAIDCDEIERKTPKNETRDSGLVSMMLRIGQYKIVGYDIVKRWADATGSEAASDVLRSVQDRHRAALTRIERVADAVIPAASRHLARV